VLEDVGGERGFRYRVLGARYGLEGGGESRVVLVEGYSEDSRWW